MTCTARTRHPKPIRDAEPNEHRPITTNRSIAWANEPLAKIHQYRDGELLGLERTRMTASDAVLPPGMIAPKSEQVT
jgi:hypothetical protein